jgi:hypothetical protein
MLRAAVLAAAGAAAAAVAPPVLTGAVLGLYLLPGNDFTNLTLISIDPATGANRTVATGLSLGDSLSQIYPAGSALLPGSGELAVAAATSDAVYAFDVTTGARRTLAPLPPYDGSDPILGLEVVGSGLFLLTQHALFAVAGGKLTQVASYTTLPDEAVTAVVPTGGTNGKGALIVGNASIADGTHVLPTVFRIDFGAGFSATGRAVNMTDETGNFSDVWDLAWSPFLGKLWAFGGWYQAWTLDPVSWELNYVQPVIDGPGYPSVNAISDDGRFFCFLDFDSFHVLDLSATPPTYIVRADFFAAPRRVGFMRWAGSPTSSTLSVAK